MTRFWKRAPEDEIRAARACTASWGDPVSQVEPINDPGPGSTPPQSHRLTRIAVPVLIALACYSLLFVVARPLLLSSISDFSFYYRAGKMLTIGEGQNVYNFTVERQYDAKWQNEYGIPGRDFPSHHFLAAPSILLIYGPLAYLSYVHAWMVWYALNVCMLLGIPFLLRNVLGYRHLFALAVLSPPFFIPLDVVLFHGQNSILLSFLLSWVFAELVKGREMRAGCILALVTFKPQFAIPMLLSLAIAKKWKAVVGFCSGGFALFWVCVGLVGWHSTISFPRVLKEFDQLPPDPGPVPAVMPNVRGFLYVLLHSRVPDHRLQALTLVLSLALMLLVVVAFRRDNQRSLALGFSLILSVTLLVSYHCLMYDTSLLLLSFFLVGGYLRGRKATSLQVALALAVYGVFLLPAFSFWLHGMPVGMFFGMLTLATFQFTELLSHLRRAPAPQTAVSSMV
jgi:hypothetical protein